MSSCAFASSRLVSSTAPLDIAGVVHQHVDPPAGVTHLAEASEVTSSGSIVTLSGRRPACAMFKHDVSARCECLRNRRTDARRCPGHENDSDMAFFLFLIDSTLTAAALRGEAIRQRPILHGPREQQAAHRKRDRRQRRSNR